MQAKEFSSRLGFFCQSVSALYVMRQDYALLPSKLLEFFLRANESDLAVV